MVLVVVAGVGMVEVDVVCSCFLNFFSLPILLSKVICYISGRPPPPIEAMVASLRLFKNERSWLGHSFLMVV